MLALSEGTPVKATTPKAVETCQDPGRAPRSDAREPCDQIPNIEIAEKALQTTLAMDRPENHHL